MGMLVEKSTDRDAYKRGVINGVKYYGKHLMVTAVSCNDNLLDIDKVSGFVKEMVPRIDMVPFGDLVIARFGEGIEEGISAVQLIMTSAITIHTNDMARDMYLDVFSCKWFDEAVIAEMIKEFFDPEEIKENIILRR
ncbi:MAG: S-adenosylmethionine decarboxylase [Spirochaetes bacterium]|jgi:S-adenosylmethionine/arginine decarboxylase-like enzyme|nr:S-adenosylmethionine decarboxylase [Spirochaetota bacterium]